MALTLREILELQRRQREETEARSATPAPVRPAEAKMPLQPSVPTPAPQEAAAKAAIPEALRQHDRIEKPAPKGLMARLQQMNGSGNGVALPALRNETAPPASIPTPPVQLPIYTADETDTLKKNLAFLAANMEEKEMIGQILRTTIRQLHEHPELSSIMIDTDYDLIVAAARRSMKYAVRKKEDRSEAKGKRQEDVDKLEAWLKDQGMDL